MKAIIEIGYRKFVFYRTQNAVKALELLSTAEAVEEHYAGDKKVYSKTNPDIAFKLEEVEMATLAEVEQAEIEREERRAKRIAKRVG